MLFIAHFYTPIFKGITYVDSFGGRGVFIQRFYFKKNLYVQISCAFSAVLHRIFQK